MTFVDAGRGTAASTTGVSGSAASTSSRQTASTSSAASSSVTSTTTVSSTATVSTLASTASSTSTSSTTSAPLDASPPFDASLQAEGGAGDASALSAVALVPMSTGYVTVPSLGIAGSWYAYGDGMGPDDLPPGICETAGMHSVAECSSITSPPPPTGPDAGPTRFPPSSMGMCLSGTAAQVIDGDYSNIFGIGTGIDLNNTAGTANPYSAQGHGVVGFTFTVSGFPAAPAPAVRFEIDEPATNAACEDSWSITIPGDGTYTVLWNDLVPSFAYSCTSPATMPPFDPTQLLSLQFHLVTDTLRSYTATNFCISGLAALVSN